MTFDQKLDNWVAVHRIGKKTSTVHYHQEIADCIRAHWPDVHKDASAVTDADVTTFLEAIGHYSATRFNAMLSVVQAICDFARDVSRRPVTLRDRDDITQEKFQTLLAEADKLKRSKAALVINFLAHTGMRITEARKLRWADVRDDYVLVPGAITKNGRPKAVPFVNGMRGLLDRLRALTGNTGFVLPRGSVRGGLAIACERAGVWLTHHDFRHLFTTRCIESGVDIPTVARWRGDSDGGAMLVRVYFHLADRHSRLMAQRVQI